MHALTPSGLAHCTVCWILIIMGVYVPLACMALSMSKMGAPFLPERPCGKHPATEAAACCHQCICNEQVATLRLPHVLCGSALLQWAVAGGKGAPRLVASHPLRMRNALSEDASVSMEA